MYIFMFAVFDEFIAQSQTSRTTTSDARSDLNDGLVYLNSVKSEMDSAYQSEGNLELDVLDLLNLANGTGIVRNSQVNSITSTCIQPSIVSDAFQSAALNGAYQSALFAGMASNPVVSTSHIGGSVTVPVVHQPSKQQQLLQQLLEMQPDVSSTQLITQLINQMQTEQHAQAQLMPQQVVLPIAPQLQQVQQAQQMAAQQPKLTMTLETAMQLIQQAGLQQSLKPQVQLSADLSSQMVQQSQIAPQQISLQTVQPQRLVSTNIHTPAPIHLGISKSMDQKSFIQSHSSQQQQHQQPAQRLIIQQVQPQSQVSPLPATVALPQSVIISTQPQMPQPQQPSQITLQQLQQVLLFIQGKA